MEVTIALDLYDRHLPFFLGTVTSPPGIQVVPLEVGMAPPRRHGINRHARMLHGREFDFAELSLASYIIARSRGEALTAIPVFPRRLFSQNHIWVRSDSSFGSPADLQGKRVLVWSFQTTLSVLAKGDMLRDYGVDWREMTWVTQYPEEMALQPSAGVRIEYCTAGKSVLQMLQDGDVDAFINPLPDREVLESSAVRRLFPNVVEECAAHFHKHGFLPIMHLMSVRRELAEQHPGLLREIARMWEEARAQSEDYFADPAFSQIAFARQALDAQRAHLGKNLWPSGFSANRKNLQFFLDDCLDQGLLTQPMSAEQLFHPSTLDS